MKRHERGFTLLEVLVALAIAATGIAAMVQAMGGRAARAQVLQDRITGTWVAGNRMAELRLSRAWPGAGVSTGSEIVGDRTLWIRQRVLDTPDPDVRRVEVTIFGDEDEESQVAYIFGYLLKPTGAAS